jgi:predicted transposase YbfD/YdcC
MARKAKKLQELQTMFDENDIDFSIIKDIIVIKDLIARVEKIPDFRDESYVKHKLSDIVMLTLFAILSNANEWSEIEAFGIKKEKWLRNYLELKNGMPSDDTIRIVISNIDSRYFYEIVIEFFMEIITNLTRLANATTTQEPDIISIDGKTSCGSKRNDTDIMGTKALHTLNAYSNDYGICIGQVFVDEKSNEIPAAKDLLKIIDIKDTIVTWDALNTQKSTVEAVIKNKGDYVGALKGNQGNLYDDVKDYFDDEELKKIKKEKENYVVTKEKEHSAIVTREYFLTTNIKWLFVKKDWKGLKSIGVEKKTIEKKNGQIINEDRYFICSIESVETFAKAVRGHWGVENSLHWHLDFTFKDDKNTTMRNNGAKNLQIVKKIALSILRTVQTFYKVSLKMIRYRLSLDFNNEISTIFKLLNVEDLKRALYK